MEWEAALFSSWRQEMAGKRLWARRLTYHHALPLFCLCVTAFTSDTIFYSADCSILMHSALFSYIVIPDDAVLEALGSTYCLPS